MKMSTLARAVCQVLSRALATGLFCSGVLSHVPAHAASVPGEILVKLRSSDAITALLTRYDLTLKGRFGSRPIFRLGAGPMADVQATLTALRLEPAVLMAEENAIHGSPEARRNMVWAIGTPEQYQQQWAQAALHLSDAQRISTGKGIRVAVLDTGVDSQHPLLAGKLMPGYDFVDGDLDPSEEGTPFDAGFGHGTHVAGIILTVAPDARIMPLRVLDAQGMGNTWVLAEALLYAVDPDGNPATDDGADVINLSLGGPVRTRILQSIARIANCNFQPVDADDDDDDPGYNGDKDRCAASRGVTIVAAAGNDSGMAREYPAAEGVDGLAAVAASGQNKRLAKFSNSGSWIDLAAPGDAITSSVPGGGYATWGGTSMATPWVTGAAALLLANEPQLWPRDVVRRMVRSASPLCGSTLAQLDPVAALLNRGPAGSNCP
jgi:subtilisin family serine protease